MHVVLMKKLFIPVIAVIVVVGVFTGCQPKDTADDII